MLKLVKQKHENGCVPASIATLATIKYNDALKFFHSKKDWSKSGASYVELLKGLKKAGFKIRVRRICSLDKIKSNAMLVIRHYHPSFNGGLHAVVWDHKAQRVLDPYPNKRRLLKRHLPIKSYEKSMVEIFEVR